MMELVKTLSGHSGCNLYLYQDNNIYFVRKDSGKENYNRRLKKQFIKQRSFFCYCYLRLINIKQGL